MKKEAVIKKNENYTLRIEDTGSIGEGIGKIDGFTMFVEGTVPGDTVEIKAIKIKNAYGYGKLLNILQPSADRVAPLCANSDRCGGCQLQNYSYESQLNLKRKKVQDALERIGKLEGIEVKPTIGMDNHWHYRNKAQFPVGIKNGKVQIGFYAPRTHNIVDMQTCHIQHPINDKIIEIVKAFIIEYGIEPYKEETHKGLIRHILTRVGFHTGEIMVCIVINGKKLPYAAELTQRLRTIDGMTSIVLNFNTNRNNVILGDKVELVWGNMCITDTIGNVKFEISPTSFYQVNPVQTNVLYQKALEYADLTGTEIVWDAYCGIGTISLFLAQKAKKVYGVEIVDAAIQDAKRNAEINNITNAEFFTGRAEEIIPQMYKEKGIKADVIVVDPPRKGCDEALLQTMLEMAPEKIVYVSCDPGTLARDLAVLVNGGYQIREVQPVDMFPVTSHVETVVLIEKK